MGNHRTRAILGVAMTLVVAGCSGGGLGEAHTGPPAVDLTSEISRPACGQGAIDLESGTMVHLGEPGDYDIRMDATTFVATDAFEVIPHPTSVWLGFESAQVQVAANGETDELEFVAHMLTSGEGTLVGISEVEVGAGVVEVPEDDDQQVHWREAEGYGPVLCDGRGELALTHVGDGVYSTHLVVQAFDADGAPVITWVDPNGTGADIDYHGGDRAYWESMFDRPEAPARTD